MSALGVLYGLPGGTDEVVPYVEVSCVDAAGRRRRRLLLDCATARFEDVVPVRPFRWSWGSRHFPGWYWPATTGQHVGFESWLERDYLVLMDFDLAVVQIASQPFCCTGTTVRVSAGMPQTSSCAARMARPWSSTSAPTIASRRAMPRRSK